MRQAIAEIAPGKSGIEDSATTGESGDVQTGVPAVVSDRWTDAGVLVVGAAAGVMSWAGWVGLAEMCGWRGALAWLLPIAVDVYAMVAARVWLRCTDATAKTRAFARASTLSAVVAGVLANTAYHLMSSVGWRTAPWSVVVATSALPPLMLFCIAHLSALRNADRARAAALFATPAHATEPVALEPAAEPVRSIVEARPVRGAKVARMRVYWDAQVADGRVPSTAELARNGGAHPSHAYKKRAEWLAVLSGAEVAEVNP